MININRNTLLWSVLMTTLFMASEKTLQAQNPINLNGSFELNEVGDTPPDSILNWSIRWQRDNGDPRAYFEIVDDPVLHGERAMMVAMVSPVTDNPWNAHMVNHEVPIDPGFTYRYSIWAKTDQGLGTADFTVGYYDFTEIGRLGYRANPNEITSEWQRFSFQFTPEREDDFWARAVINVNLPENEDRILFFDNLSIIELAGPPGPVPPGENVVRNGDFELSFAGDTPGEIFAWSFQGHGDKLADFVIVDDPVYETSKSLKMAVHDIGPNPWSIQAINQEGSIEEGKTYRFSLWAKSDREGSVIQGVASNQRFAPYHSLIDTLGTDWQEMSFDFLVDDDEEQLRTTIYGNFEENIGSTIFIEQVTVYELTGEPTLANKDITVSQFYLHPNYPNPFNPSTRIQFDLERNEFVVLEVFSLEGRKIATLLNGEKSKGNHVVYFDASDLSSGTYVYRLSAGSYSQTRKMTLIK